MMRSQEMQVHKEASKESSLDGCSQSSNKERGSGAKIKAPLGEIKNEGTNNDYDNGLMSPNDEEINPNSSSIVNQEEEDEEDENQSSMHSRFIEDLLGDGDQTEVDLIS
jgi:hypothetical protein